jgi:hypothetical protein
MRKESKGKKKKSRAMTQQPPGATTPAGDAVMQTRAGCRCSAAFNGEMLPDLEVEEHGGAGQKAASSQLTAW